MRLNVIARCPSLSQSGHHDRAEPCPLSGVKRTSLGLSEMSAYDSKRTSLIAAPCSQVLNSGGEGIGRCIGKVYR